MKGGEGKREKRRREKEREGKREEREGKRRKDAAKKRRHEEEKRIMNREGKIRFSEHVSISNKVQEKRRQEKHPHKEGRWLPLSFKQISAG